MKTGWQINNAIEIPMPTQCNQAYLHRLLKIEIQNYCKQTHSPKTRNGKISHRWIHSAKKIKLKSTNSCIFLLVVENAQPNSPPLRLIEKFCVYEACSIVVIQKYD